MRRSATTLLAAFLPLLGASAIATAVPPPAPPISGVVRSLEQPIAGALVIFYNLGDTTLTRSRSAPDGTFVLATAPVGVSCCLYFAISAARSAEVGRNFPHTFSNRLLMAASFKFCSCCT